MHPLCIHRTIQLGVEPVGRCRPRVAVVVSSDVVRRRPTSSDVVRRRCRRVAAARRLLQGRTGHRAVLDHQGGESGRERRHVLQQVQHGQRLVPLADGGGWWAAHAATRGARRYAHDAPLMLFRMRITNIIQNFMRG